MKKVISILALVVSLIIVPVLSVSAAIDYTDWENVDTYHLYDDVRTITFSHAVDQASLQQEDAMELWDVTKKEQPVKLSIDLSIVQENPKQVQVQLAGNSNYQDGHNYTLNIHDTIKPAVINTTLKENIAYHFTMEYMLPEKQSFTKTYEITNNLGKTESVNVPKGASYVIYNAYGTAITNTGKADSTDTYLTLGAGESATVSFLTNDVIQEQQGIKITEISNPDEAAYTIYKLYERNSVEITNADKESYLHVYAGNTVDADETVHHSYAHYEKYGKPEEYDYNTATTNQLKQLSLYPSNTAVVTNENDGFVYVFVPNTRHHYTTDTTNFGAYENDAVIADVLSAGQTLKATSTLDEYSSITFRDTTREGQFSYVSYRENTLHDKAFMKTAYEFGDDNPFTVAQKGETIVENHHITDAIVFGPAKHITFSSTDEKPFSTFVLENEAIAEITSTEDTQNGASKIGIRDLSQRGSFATTVYDKDGVNSVGIHEMYTFGDDSTSVYPTGYTLIQNVDKYTQTLYGAQRFVTFTASDVVPVVSIELQPGETATVRLKDNSTNDHDVFAFNQDKDTSLTYIRYSNGVPSKSVDMSNIKNFATRISITKDSYIEITNNSDYPFTLYGASPGLTIEK